MPVLFGIITVSLNPEMIRNTVGCGDVLPGAFVAGVHGGKSVRDAFADAVAAATACHVATAEFDKDFLAELRENIELNGL